MRRITDGYTTLAEVYRYIIEESLIDKNIRALKAQFDNPPDVIVKIDPQDYDVVADLDELLATDESNLWDDDDTQTL